MRLAKKPAASITKPVEMKSKRKSAVTTPMGSEKDRIFFEDGRTELDAKQVSLVIKALLKKIPLAAAAKEENKKELFEDDGQRITLQVAGIKLPKDHRQQLLRIPLPHKPLPNPHTVCLIVKDLEKGIRPDHEPTVQHFRKLLKSKAVKMEVDIMALRELKVEYKPFEAKTALCHKYDKFLIDDRIIRLVPKFLGKPFYKRKKFPVQVNLKASDLEVELEQGCRTVMLPLSHHGSCSMVEVGNTQMKSEDLAENVLAISHVLAKRYPGGWKNIRSLQIKTEKSLAIPIHISTVSPNDVGFVDVDIPQRVSKKAVTDELSTQPGMEVTVLPGGTVKIIKTKDPAWDNEKDEPFVEDSEEEEEEEEDQKEEVKKKSKKEKGKKRKSSTKLDNASSKKKKSSKPDSDNSDDEQIEKVEEQYRKRVAEEENSPSAGDKNVQEEEDSKDQEEDEESEYDDDQELDAADIIVDENEESNEGDDDDDKLILKRKNDDSD